MRFLDDTDPEVGKVTDPVLFLDIDGVLNTIYTPYLRNRRMDADKIKRLNRIMRETGAVVVLSTAWRAYGIEYVQRALANHGFQFADRVIARTPQYHGEAPRGLEIAAWLDAHPEVRRFAIVDDWDEMCHLRPFHILTHEVTGMLDTHADRIIRRLTAPCEEVEEAAEGLRPALA